MLETVKIGVWETPERFRCHAVFTAWHLNLFVHLEQGTGVEPVEKTGIRGLNTHFPETSVAILLSK